ncbi:MAG: DUF2339 domain-containing protein [bacterium]|nr:DUF2339 domain-containing protein [bacterium]
MSTFFLLVLIFIISLYFKNRIDLIDSKLKQFETKKLVNEPLKSSNQDIKPNKDFIYIKNPAVQTNQINTSTFTKPKNEDNLSFDQFINWLKEDWLLKIGGVFILLGFAWLVSYAFLNNWIGPVGRITLGLLAGVLIMVSGNKRIIRYKNQGLVIIAVGASISLITIYSAQSLYSMFPPVLALLLSTIVTVFCGVASVVHNDKPLTIIALISGTIAPLLTGNTDPNIFGLFSYLLSLNIGILWVTYYKNWRFLVILSLLLTSMYSIQFFAGSSFTNLLPSELIQLKFFAITFTTLYFTSEVLLIIKTKVVQQTNLVTGLLIGLFTLGWITGLIPTYLRGEVTLIVAVIFMLASYYIFKITKIQNIVFTYFGTSLLLLIAATSFEFSGPTLTIALTIQALILPVISSKLLNRSLGFRMLLYLILPGLLSIESITSISWSTGIFHQDLLVLILYTATLFILGYNQIKTFIDDEGKKAIGKVLVIVGGIYSLILVWLMINSLIETVNIARTVTLILYTFIGLVTNIKGQINNNKYLNRFGLGVIVFVTLRLLFVDVWDMQLGWRTVTFLGTGLLLMGSVLIPRNITHEKVNVN